MGAVFHAYRKMRALFVLLFLCALICAQSASFASEHSHQHSSQHCLRVCHVGPLPLLQPVDLGRFRADRGGGVAALVP